MKPLIIFIVGPTSSGKSDVAVELAERISGEVISCDSMQVYKNMSVINRVPSPELRKRVKHYLIEEIPAGEDFSASEFVRKAKAYISTIRAKRKIPIIVGGTGLYMRALLDGLFNSPPADRGLREELAKISREQGNVYLHSKLRSVDPAAAAKIHENDIKRVIRALEVYQISGRTMSEKKNETKGISSRVDARIFALDISRGKLYERIEATVDKMFEEGIIDEVRELKKKKLSLTAVKALGINEISVYLEGGMTLDEAKKELKKNTRRYAKRQLTWFRADKRIVWLDGDREPDRIAEEILDRLQTVDCRLEVLGREHV